MTSTSTEKEEINVTRAVKYKVGMSSTEDKKETNANALDLLLENEKQHNKVDTWNKLNKTMKIQKLNQYAIQYAQTNHLDEKELNSLKTFFNDCLDKSKLQRTKDVVYDKEKGIITNIPALTVHASTRAFTLKNMDNKHVSTIKSLTPKKNVTKINILTASEDETNNKK